jgi:hypothetical protein
VQHGSGYADRLEKSLVEYQEKDFSDAADMFMSNSSAASALNSYVDKQQLESVMSSGLQILDDPYWFSILQGVYRLRVQELRSKTNISIRKGAMLMGIPDPAGVLRENQVFVNIQLDEKTASDFLPTGAVDPLAKEMAKSQAMAVDYPKTGLKPKVPKEALKRVDLLGYPDFMEKTLEISYVSNKILGSLHRRCCSILFDFQMVKRKGDLEIELDQGLLVEGREYFLGDAEQVYFAYEQAMEEIISKFTLRTEADVILCRPTHKWTEMLKGDKGKVSDAIGSWLRAIVARFRSEFFADVASNKQKRQKASAWYAVAYGNIIRQGVHVANTSKRRSKAFLSFPWLVWDVLAKIKKESHQIQTPSLNCDFSGLFSKN